MVIYLKRKIRNDDFKIIFRFAFWGFIGGGLGFGLGGFWMVLGSYLPDVIFKEWWKAMEFSFGLILGAALGFAAWLSRGKIMREMVLIFVTIMIIGVITAYIRRGKNVMHNLFLLIVWSTVVVAFFRLTVNTEVLNVTGLSFCKIVCEKFFVHITFTLSALLVSWISLSLVLKNSKIRHSMFQ